MRHGQVCTEVKEGGSVCVPGVSHSCGVVSLCCCTKDKVFPPGEQIFLLGFQIWVSLQGMSVSVLQHLRTACVKLLGAAGYNGYSCHSQTVSQTAICDG